MEIAGRGSVPSSALGFLIREVPIHLKGMSQSTYDHTGMWELRQVIQSNPSMSRRWYDQNSLVGDTYISSNYYHCDISGFPVSQIGDATLYLSLRQPPTDSSLIRAKQEAVAEIRSNPQLRTQLESFIEGTVAKSLLEERHDPAAEELRERIHRGYDETHEHQFNRLLKHLYFRERFGSEPDKMYYYNWIHRVYAGSYRYLHHLSNVPDIHPHTRYLGELIEHLTDFQHDKIARLIKKTIPEYQKKTEPLNFFARFTNFITLPLRERVYEFSKLNPLRAACLESHRLVNAIDSLGKIDELLALAQYADNLIPPITLPIVEAAPAHFFTAEELRNPTLATSFNSEYYLDPDSENWVSDGPDGMCQVGNDFTFGGGVSIITGPVSGGKTADAMTILQTQLLAQIGSFVPAISAHLAIADRIAYCGPANNELGDEEGRCGTEMAAIAEEWKHSSPKSLVIFDELLHATTDEERRDISGRILKAFSAMKNTTILITHDFEMAKRLRDLGLATVWRKQFKRGKPTFKIIRGISTNSQSEKVLGRYGLTEEAMAAYLEGFGQEMPDWGLE